MLDKVKKTIERFKMLAPGDRVLVGVSGGPDSTSLLHILWRLRRELDLDLLVFHLDHMFRGEESRQDACYVQRLAHTLGVPAIIKRVNVPAVHREQGGSPQAVAREVRYHLFRQACLKTGRNKVAVGHNLDDQVETVLMRFLRGSGLQGLAGIPPVRKEGGVEIVRPLLEVSREEILAYCREQGLNPRWDRSNEKPVYLRNKIRLELVPWLVSEFNPNLKQLLTENAFLWREENDYLDQQAREWYEKLVNQAEVGRVSLSLEGLQLVHPVILRRVLRRAIAAVKGNLVDVKQAHLSGVQALIQRGQVGSQLNLPGGIEMERTYREVIVRAEKEDRQSAPSFCYSLPVPGEIVLPWLGLHLRTRVIKAGELKDVRPTPRRACFDYDLISEPLLVRNRRFGDRFYPAGLGGSKKLKDYFIDVKIPRDQRDRIPLVTTSSGEILWVVGWRQDSRFQVGDKTEQVLVIELDSMKGEAIENHAEGN